MAGSTRKGPKKSAKAKGAKKVARGAKSPRTASKSAKSKRAAGSAEDGGKTDAASTGRHRAEDAVVAQPELLETTKLYYRIGEVSRITGVKAHVLRYWETEFRWMSPPKSRAKQRLYRKRDIEMVLTLKRLLWEERYTIAGARQRIQELGLAKALGETRGEEGEPDRVGASAGSDPKTATSSALPAGLLERVREVRAGLADLRASL